jgi:hypothetical protein
MRRCVRGGGGKVCRRPRAAHSSACQLYAVAGKGRYSAGPNAAAAAEAKGVIRNGLSVGCGSINGRIDAPRAPTARQSVALAVGRAVRGVSTPRARHEGGICKSDDCGRGLRNAVHRRGARWVGAAAAPASEFKVKLGAVAARRVRARLEYVGILTHLPAYGASYT